MIEFFVALSVALSAFAVALGSLTLWSEIRMLDRFEAEAENTKSSLAAVGRELSSLRSELADLRQELYKKGSL